MRVRVANPENGMYIRRKGNTVTKVFCEIRIQYSLRGPACNAWYPGPFCVVTRGCVLL